MAVGPKEAQQRAMAASRLRGGGVAVKERPIAKPKAGASRDGPPKKPPVEVAAAGPEKSKGYALLVRGVPEAMKDRLERARAAGGHRSVNDAVLVILEKGAPK